MTKPKLIAGNWKMHGNLLTNQQLATDIVEQTRELSVQLAVFPPLVHLMAIAEILAHSSVLLGAQNLCDHSEGAFTGEVSGTMLRDCRCHFVLVGHSERRTLYGETDEVVAQKLLLAKKAGLRPILCVGETLAERDQGWTELVIARQLMAVQQALANDLTDVVIAYEPVWAIGTGKTASPEQAQAVHQFIRQQLDNTLKSLPILYGGSVNENNAAKLFAMPDIDGGLVGGASLRAHSFAAIAQAAAEI